MTRIIAIHSYRGGTGKSHFTANLGATLARAGHRVGVVDTDIPSPGIHNLLGLEQESCVMRLNNYLWGECAITDAAYDVTGASQAQGDGRLWLVPASVEAEDIARMLNESYDVRRLNDGLRSLGANLPLDYLLIDTHPGLSRETFLSIALSDLAILVVRPDKQDYQGTAVVLDVARRLKVRRIALVMNKVHSRIDPTALKLEVERAYDAAVLGMFPLSEDVASVASDGLFSVRHPGHPITAQLAHVARQIVELT